jgi:hypothetical protein
MRHRHVKHPDKLVTECPISRFNDWVTAASKVLRVLRVLAASAPLTETTSGPQRNSL